MPSKREDIIARLFSVVSAPSVGFLTAKRNCIEFDDTQLPAVSVLEGDEAIDEGDAHRGRPASRPRIVLATPQVYIRVSDSNVGTTLNAFREAVIDAVESDAQLIALSINGRRVNYTGMQTTLHAARTMQGAAALVFEIAYIQN